MMEDKDSLIAELKEEIRTRNEELHLAATYGKQLCDKNSEMSLKIDNLMIEKESLEQEKHSLQLVLEARYETINSQSSELELQRNQADILSEKFEFIERKNDILQKKIERLTKENEDLKRIVKDISVEKQSLQEQMDVLEKQIRNFQDQTEKSMCEIDNDESLGLQTQLNTYILNNKELQDGLYKSQQELEISKKNENQLLQMLHELEEAVNEKNLEISAQHAELKKAKEEIEELQAEVEVLKFDQVDVKQRGNSVFAELDDRRNLVEREYKILRKKYEHMQKYYDENVKELDRVRGQVAILQSMASRDYQQAYIDKLEDTLSSARRDCNDLMHKFAKAVKDAEIVRDPGFIPKNEYDYLRVMLNQQRQREKELQNDVVNITSKNMYDNDKLVETQHMLYKAKEDLDNAKQEILKLKQKIKDLERGALQLLPNEPQISKPKIEILDECKLSKGKENEFLNKSLNKSRFDDFDMIPGEIELDEDGFHQIKPPRKSNKFKLQEFNRLKLDDGETIESSDSSCNKIQPIEKRTEKGKLVSNKTEQIERTSEKGKLVSETERRKFTSKTSSRRRDDNCAQQ